MIWKRLFFFSSLFFPSKFYTCTSISVKTEGALEAALIAQKEEW